MKRYELPKLKYSFDALEPFISRKNLELHYTKNHAAYVNGANNTLEKLEKFRRGELEIDVKATLRDLSFNLSGHILHVIFWESMAPPNTGKNIPFGKIGDKIKEDFGSFEVFKKEFSSAAKTCEGNGWAILVFDQFLNQLLVVQIEKHNIASISGLKVLLALDVWEHSWVLDYNDRSKYIENWWNIVSFDYAEKEFSKLSF
ncbi:MAG: superoxide dismutase [Candidatus Aenigmarchaeota archaeon]|nr:superoxide dismutase [Candidatus Aenigmarchaeota archaeon]MDW8149397.1 superoxide dismutase [Candidatus Aenigmarchaeota archaeon]